MNTPRRFVICGWGYIGKRHADLAAAKAEVAAIVDLRADYGPVAEARYGAPFFTSLENCLRAVPDVDVVSVCTPNGLHAEHALSALAAGCHVVIEKPMALRAVDCEAVILKAEQVGRQVFVVMQNRYSPVSQWLKALLDSGRLGPVFLAQINCFWNRDDRYYTPGSWRGDLRLDGGPLFTQFSHFVDILYWLFGDLSDINARFDNFNHQHNTQFEDTGLAQFRLTQGGMGALHYTTAAWDKNFESSLTVIGANGVIKVGGQYMNEITYCHLCDYTLPELPPTNPPNDYGTHFGSANNHLFMFQNVLDTLDGISHPTTDASEGLKVVEIIERIYAHRR